MPHDGSRTSHSIQKEIDLHVVMDVPATLINHSCDANTGIRDNELGAFDFWLLKDVRKGEQFTWDYSAAELEPISADFECNCGSHDCRGHVGGFRNDAAVIRHKYGEYYANFLKKLKLD